MKRKKLKPAVKKTMISLSLIVFAIVITYLVNNKTTTVSSSNDDFTYVNDYIFDDYTPVINSDEKLIKPYNSEKVSIYKNFYDADSEEEQQENSIIYYENVYMQNSGVDYTSDEEFDVLSSLSGTVTNVSDDNLLGKTVEIRNSNELVLLYQSLKDVSVKKGDTVYQGQVIGKSGSCTLYSDINNDLHFEIYKNGSVLNPEKYYDKTISELKEN